jgi:hypothetical protein
MRLALPPIAAGGAAILVAIHLPNLHGLHPCPPPPPSSNLQLPIKYVGYSTCFRKEAGSHGRDTLGIFRWVGRAAKGMCMCGFLGEVGLRREGIGTGQLMAGAGEATVALAERPCCHSGCNVMREKAGTPHPYVVA